MTSEYAPLTPHEKAALSAAEQTLSDQFGRKILLVAYQG